ncbi:MAG: hypothetical protein ACRYFK_03370 [Janthinobacterium lividum]
MLRTTVSLCLLALLALPLAPTHAQPTWWFWLSRPERHGQRKLAGDFTHINSTYRFHSRERRGLFGFLHRGGRPNLARHHQGGHSLAPAAPRKSRTTL